MKRDLLPKFQGCLLGQAAADAIGFPFEGRAADVVRPFFEESLFKVFDYELPEEELQKYMRDLDQLPKAEARRSGRW